MAARQGTGAAATQRARELDLRIDRLVSAPERPEGWLPSRPAVRRILACVGESDATAHVLSWSRELARLFDAEVTLIHVTRMGAPSAIYPIGPVGIGTPVSLPPVGEAEIRERADRMLREARHEIERDVPEVATLRREGHPGDEIVRAARELASDLIVIGHHEGGRLDRLLVGSTTDHVKGHTRANVLIARSPPKPGPILAGVDGSLPSREAAQLADEIARRWDAKLHLLHAVPRGWRAAEDPIAEELRARVLEDGTTTSLAGVELDARAGDPRDVLRVSARGMDASLIALGSRGTSGIRSLLPGSVGNALSHDAPTSVLLVREPTQD